MIIIFLWQKVNWIGLAKESWDNCPYLWFAAWILLSDLYLSTDLKEAQVTAKIQPHFIFQKSPFTAWRYKEGEWRDISGSKSCIQRHKNQYHFLTLIAAFFPKHSADFLWKILSSTMSSSVRKITVPKYANLYLVNKDNHLRRLVPCP